MKNSWLVILYSLFSFGQNQYPKDYFRSPLDIPLQLSGNFGELRPNHIHSGFDFKTQQKEGLYVYAAADGYISRIKISQAGYGKAIYITHPNGYTSVYGHLKSGFGEIEKYIKNQQYKAKSYEMEVLPTSNDLIVHKGDLIALSGNTGGSDGPHLHFEIRDTQSEKIINPMYFGFDDLLLDTKRPQITSLWIYPIEENTIVNQSKRPIFLSLTQQEDGSFISEKVMAQGNIGFGITSIDFDNVSWNANGIFSVKTFLNGKPDFGYQFDTFSFDETRYVNALIDYTRYKKLGQRVQKLFMKNNYPLSLIQLGESNGIINVTSNISQTYRIQVSDFAGNSTEIFIPIQYSSLPEKIKQAPVTSKYLVKVKKDNIFAMENVTVTIPAHTFLDDFYLNFDVKQRKLNLHEDIVPAFSNFQITFEDSLATDNDREKMFIGLFYDKKTHFYNTKKFKNSFSIYTKYLGEYKLIKDSIPPKLKIAKNIAGKWISNQKEIEFTVVDDLSGIKTYDGYLNGKWILLEYESKTNQLIHQFADGIVDEGQNDLKVVVTDNVGNSTIFETQFFRSQKP